MPTSRNVNVVSYIDCPGGGQVWIDGTTLFVAHMKAPDGTSVYDVADPKSPRLLAHVEIPAGWHSNKVRARDGVMIVNHERHGEGGDGGFGGGLGIYDLSAHALRRPELGKMHERLLGNIDAVIDDQSVNLMGREMAQRQPRSPMF